MSADLIIFSITFLILLWINIGLYRNDWANRVNRRSMVQLFSGAPAIRLLKLRLICGSILLLIGFMVALCIE